MTTKSNTEDVIARHGAEIMRRRNAGEGMEPIAYSLGLSYHAVRTAIRAMSGDAPTAQRATNRPTVADLRSAVEPDERDDLDGLIGRRVDAFRRKAAKSAPRVHRIERPGPFAVCHLGDPHLDDDGCDWPELIRVIRAIKRTPDMFAGNVGDTVNNWVGRLQALYAHQTTTEGEAFELARWLLEAVEWDYLILGNHDKWNQGSTIIRLLAERAKIRVIEDHEARIEYSDGTRVCVRHSFKGSSMWNPLHGSMRRAKMRPWGDVYVSGHHHEFAHHTEEQEGKLIHAIKLRGFKRFDSYSAEHDFPDGEHGCSMTTVHRPWASHIGSRLTVWHDVEEAAEYLAWAKRRDGGST